MNDANSRILYIGDGSRSDVPLADDVFTDMANAVAGGTMSGGKRETGWPRVHPGPLNAGSGYRELTAEADFSLEGIPEAGLLLELRGRGVSGPCPDFRVAVNGYTGIVLARQRRNDRRHDPLPPSPTAGLIERDVTIPSSALRLGANRLEITTISLESPHPSEMVKPFRPELADWFGSTMRWESITIRQGSAIPSRIDVEPLPLYVRSENEIRERVDVIIENVHGLAASTARIWVDGEQVEDVVASESHTFGDLSIPITISDRSKDFSVTVELDGPAGRRVEQFVCTPARKWTVHVSPHVHVDVGYTDQPARVRELHSRNIDKAIDLIDADPTYRFSIDGAMLVADYLRTRTKDQADRLFGHLRSGALAVNPFFANLLTGVTGDEDLKRSLYFAARLAREHGLPLDFANLTDVPTYSQALPDLLSAEGIGSFLGMTDHIRGGNADSDSLHLTSPFRWSGPSGRSVLAFFSDCYTQLRFVCGDPVTTPGVARGLTELLRRYDRDDYLPTDFLLAGTNSDNEDLAHGYAGLVESWNAQYEWPKLRFSTPTEYFESVAPLREQLPEVRGDGGAYWEDGMGTQALSTAKVRRAQTMLPAAETTIALASLYDARIRPDQNLLDEAWKGVVLGTEHTWAADISTSKPSTSKGAGILAWTVANIAEAERASRDAWLSASSVLADQITVTSVPSILAFNSLSWMRDVEIEVEIDVAQEVRRADGRTVPTRRLSSADGLQRVRIRVPDMPAFGYEMLSVLPVAPTLEDDDGAESTGVPGARADIDALVSEFNAVGTDFLEVDLDGSSGRLRSVRRRHDGRQMLDATADYALGDVLYATDGGSAEHRGLGPEINSLYDYDPTLSPADIRVEAIDTTLTEISRTAEGGWILSREGSNEFVSAKVELELLKDSEEVFVRVELEKRPNLAKESVYVAFPFAMRAPKVLLDRQQGWVDPARDHYAGACYEWYTVHDSAIVADADGAVEWHSADAPLVALGDVVRGTWPTQPAPASGHIFSWVMNNYWHTNVAATQEGRIRLNYAFRVDDAGSRSRAWKDGRSLRTGGVSSKLIQNDRCDALERSLPTVGALLEADLQDGIVASVFAGRGDAQVVVRLRDVGGGGGEARLRLPDALSSRSAGSWAAELSPTEAVVRQLDIVDNWVSARVGANSEITIGLGARPR